MADTRVALVTGAGRGIGLEISRQLARLGVMTVMGTRSLEAGQKAAEPLASEGLIATAVALDVTDPESVRLAVGEAKRLFGRLDILINNAGVMLDRGPAAVGGVSELPLQLAQETFAVNLWGAMTALQAAVSLMREQGYGRIVNVSSGMGQLSESGANHPAYRMSKTALNGLTVVAAAELAPANIKVNAMCPGWVRTDMGGPDAPRTVEQGADTAVWLASLPDDGPTGGYFRDRKAIPW